MTEMENFLYILGSVVLQAILGAIKLINENHLQTLASVCLCLKQVYTLLILALLNFQSEYIC
jgi:hypothetical protein